MRNQTADMYPVNTAQSRSMALLDDVLLRNTPNAKAALQQMLAYANTTQDAIANELGKEQYSISRMVNGNRGININELEKLINACGNLFLLQYLANKYGKKLVDISAKEALISDLEYQLQQAKKAA
jgi:antitoxin component HigA of HigAB toxin-antitoxin module